MYGNSPFAYEDVDLALRSAIYHYARQDVTTFATEITEGWPRTRRYIAIGDDLQCLRSAMVSSEVGAIIWIDGVRRIDTARSFNNAYGIPPASPPDFGQNQVLTNVVTNIATRLGISGLLRTARSEERR